MYDERNNVIPLLRRFESDPSVKLEYRHISRVKPVESLTLQQLLDAIEEYGFESEGCPLFNCVEFVELRKRIDIETLKPKPDNDETLSDG
jgi:hypothetical protein